MCSEESQTLLIKIMKYITWHTRTKCFRVVTIVDYNWLKRLASLNQILKAWDVPGCDSTNFTKWCDRQQQSVDSVSLFFLFVCNSLFVKNVSPELLLLQSGMARITIPKMASMHCHKYDSPEREENDGVTWSSIWIHLHCHTWLGWIIARMKTKSTEVLV